MSDAPHHHDASSRSQSLRHRLLQKKVLLPSAGVVLVVAVFGATRLAKHAAPAATTANNDPHVTISAVRNLHATSSFDTVGTVTAISEAHVQAEVGGQITSVPVQLGQHIAAGTVIATLENSAQKAALLSAQGTYEAAQAGAQINNLSSGDAATGLTAAVNSASAAYKDAYTTVSTVVYGTLDVFYSDPNAIIPGVRFATGDAAYLNSARVSLQTILPDWQQQTTGTLNRAQLDQALTTAIANTQQVAKLLDAFITDTKNARTTTMLDGVTVNSYTSTLLAKRATINSTIASLQSAETALQTAESAVSKAALSATSTNVSLANAQLTQAEGALRTAQANYNKTIIRTPISGTINALYVKAGQYANSNQAVALVANNNGLEVDTSVTEADSLNIAIGDTVTINDTATGTVIAKAGALDPTTGKIAIRISVSDPTAVVNGATVHVTFTEHAPTIDAAPTYTIPLTAVKLGVNQAAVFTVSSSSVLVAHPVTLGEVVGSAVIIKTGITPDMQIVTDARGLAEGQTVIVSPLTAPAQ